MDSKVSEAVANRKLNQAGVGDQAAPEPEAAKSVEPPAYTPSEATQRAQRLLEQIEKRKQERTKQIAAMQSREVEIEREEREARKVLDCNLGNIQVECNQRMQAERDAFARGEYARSQDLIIRAAHIEKLDVSLAQLHKQFEAEIAKLMPPRVQA